MIARPLAALAGQGRWLLVAGLVAGIALPSLAQAMAPAIVPFIAVMLCLAALREGPAAALPRPGTLRRSLAVTLTLQAVLPVVAALILGAAGVLHHPLAMGAVLAMAAAPITGAPGLAVMSGADPGAALRMVALGTAVLPFTVAPVFAALPLFADPLAILAAAGRLLAIVALAALVAGALRRAVPRLTRPDTRPALDGAMALAMGLVVIGLMSEIGPALVHAPAALAATLVFAVALHLAQTVGAWWVSRRTLPVGEAASVAIAAGNRNLALFLAAVPPDAALPLMVFVGCYQIPMYLTPFVMARLLPRAGPDAPGR